MEELVEINTAVQHSVNPGAEFVLDADNSKAFVQVSEWLTGGMEKNGLMLRGTPGTGKTNLVYSIAEFIFRSCNHWMEVITGRDLVEAVTGENKAVLGRIVNKDIVCFEDIGTEEPRVNTMGTHKYPFADYFSRRYELRKVTIVTTNLPPSRIEELYGIRIRERMQETLNDVVLTGKSKRTLKHSS
jgi:DNA replication protein DnaC